MSYVPGTRIDLSHINKTKPVNLKKNTASETARHLFDVGTQFIFANTPTGLKAAIRIPVVAY